MMCGYKKQGNARIELTLRRWGTVLWCGEAVSLIGVALVMLAEVHSGWILVGTGAVVLAVQVARWLMDIKIEAPG
jgi:hypothetical protein